MKKLRELRAHLVERIAEFREQPGRLHVYTEQGAVACGAGSLSYEWRYPAKIMVEDFDQPIETLIVPLLAWIAENQPDLMLSDAKAENVIRIDAEILDNSKSDILITIDGLTERVVVTAAEGGHNVTVCDKAGTDIAEMLANWPTGPDGEARTFPPLQPPEES